MGFCSSEKQVQPSRFDPLYGETAPRIREGIFADMWSKLPAIQEQAGQGARQTMARANDPAFSVAADNAAKSIRGDYLAGSPQLNTHLAQSRSAAMRGAADHTANLRDQFSRTGNLWSTAHQQANQAATAALAARLNDTEAATRYQNYMMERANQTQAPQQLLAAATAPGQLRSSATQQYLDPYRQYGEILKALAGDGQIIQPDTIIGQGTGQQVMQGLGALGTLAGGLSMMS